jgi:hypothetical protein
MNLPSNVRLAAAGLLFALGCGYLAWTFSLGLFSLVFEVLRAQALEAVLEDKSLLERVRLMAWMAGMAAGALLFWRWHRAQPALDAQPLRRWLTIALIAAGATHLGYVLMHGVPVGAMVLAAFFSLVAGAALGACLYRPLRPPLPFVGRTVLAGMAGAAVIFVALAFDKRVAQPYDRLGEERFVWIKITFAEPLPVYPEYRDISVQMHTPGGTVRGFAIAWEDEGGRKVLPMRIDFTELTPDREVIVTMPGREPIKMKMPFARNPKPMHDYSAPFSAGNGLTYRYRVT